MRLLKKSLEPRSRDKKPPCNSLDPMISPGNLGVTLKLPLKNPIADGFFNTPRYDGAMDKITALKKTEMFGSLTPVELRAVSAICTERRLKKGEILFVAGEAARGLYVIVKGSLRAYRTNEEGREQTIHVEKAGSTIAEVPVFDGQPYPSTVSAEEESEVLFISKGDVQRVFLSHPAIALGAVKLLASRLRKTSALAEALSLKEVDQRLAVFLIQEFKTQGTLKDGKYRVLLTNNSAIGARIGSVREIVSRAFSKIEKEKLVAVDKKRTAVLLNENGLRDFANRSGRYLHP